MTVPSLTIGSVDFNRGTTTQAWKILNLNTLMDGPAIRGSDRLLPGAAGVRARKRRADVTVHSMELIVTGITTSAGVRNADFAAGLWINLKYLRDNVTDPYSTGDGTRSATLYLPDGTTQTASVHCSTLQTQPVDQSSYYVKATFDLSIPAGSFA